MGKVEMDMSEYDKMQENKLLLKEAIAEQKKLIEENQRLNNEKIEALEAAKMKIVKKSVVETVETKQLISDKYHLYSEINRVLHGMHSPGSGVLIEDEVYNVVMRSFRSDTVSLSDGKDVKITTHGLEEVKDELKKELQEEFNKDYEHNKELAKENTEIRKESSETKSECNKLRKDNNDLIKKIKALEEEKTKLEETIAEKIGEGEEKDVSVKKIKDIQEIYRRNPITFVSKGQMLRDIHEIAIRK